MNTIPFTTTEPSSPTTPLTPSYTEALRYLAEVAAAQEWTDALGAMHGSAIPKHIPARRRRHSRKASRAAAGPPGLPSEIKELVQKVLETKHVSVKIPETPIAGPSSSTTPKPSLKLVPWTYPPIDEDAIAPPSPVQMEGLSMAQALEDAYSSYDSEFDTELETETETELETEVESDVVPHIHRPKVRVVIDDSEPTTPEFEAEAYNKCEPWPLVIPTPSTAVPKSTPVEIRPESPAVELGKLVDQVFAEEEENDDDEWIYGPPSYYTSPPESPHRTPAPTPTYTDDEYDESEVELERSFDLSTDPITTHHLRNDLEIIRPFSPDAPEITFTPPTWEAFFECMPPQDEAYGQLLALPGSTPLGPAELEHNTLVSRPRIQRNPTTGAQECMWRGNWTPCCWACGGVAEGMDTSLPASQRTGWFVLDGQRWRMIRS
ncbi:unnamed protein product [Rhizoctonia solani]|uniref:Uncharacterized protein n=1 Tax=Rhizoctonia solani TaxID=456999 RepID=A0A8H3D2G8_9AGAM|nr:unnamed protein product [Rhizoctonia solani]CAE6505077.1 unnamed protein product [Rhizoctonia solani]